MITRRRKSVLSLLYATLLLLCLKIIVDEQEAEVDVKHELIAKGTYDNATQNVGNFSKSDRLLTEFPYKFLIDEPHFCAEDLLVLNVMPVSVGDAEARARVRKMWGAREVVASTRLRPLFLVGETNGTEQQRRLQEESDEYHDVIQVGFVDSYLNLTLKTLSALHWKHTRCRHVPWLLKSDADVFVSPWAVTRLLSNETADIVCRLLFSKNVCQPHNCRDKRWIIPPEVYPHEFYPPYCNGPVYAVNQKSVREILTVASAENPFVMEDAYYTGILVQGLDLKYNNIGSRCQLYHLKHLPYNTVGRGRSLFLVNPERKSRDRYTLEDVWNYLVSLRT
ncbi:beta-1,3-galactosyltransferase 2-like [Penaeus monodon]|uniref:beta-1,3-galactosyltransferase 2-like n=1 Tax=Penaeus monodon TaxID=6687 RepID=UPI0018A76AD1|nr:beta-1,3-galactosyltransferase 2-like [Penaeus monodon]XP_037783726.1 beta-1,3-galactosyltransferase 2-like [Penaeus monodon]